MYKFYTRIRSPRVEGYWRSRTGLMVVYDAKWKMTRVVFVIKPIRWFDNALRVAQWLIVSIRDGLVMLYCQSHRPSD